MATCFMKPHENFKEICRVVFLVVYGQQMGFQNSSALDSYQKPQHLTKHIHMRIYNALKERVTAFI